MDLLVVEKHDGYGDFPLFEKGASVNRYNPCASDEYPHWSSCEINGYETFIADVYVDSGVLAKDYNPTELIVDKGKLVTLIDIVYEWVYVKDETGKTGWLPASKVISASH